MKWNDIMTCCYQYFYHISGSHIGLIPRWMKEKEKVVFFLQEQKTWGTASVAVLLLCGEDFFLHLFLFSWGLSLHIELYSGWVTSSSGLQWGYCPQVTLRRWQCHMEGYFWTNPWDNCMVTSCLCHWRKDRLLPVGFKVLSQYCKQWHLFASLFCMWCGFYCPVLIRNALCGKHSTKSSYLLNIAPMLDWPLWALPVAVTKMDKKSVHQIIGSKDGRL